MTRPGPGMHLFDDGAAMAAAAAAHVAQRLRAAAEERGSASLSLSGGSTPGPVYRALAGEELPWDKVAVTLSDERWVDPASEHSNERLARQTLLDGPPAAARFAGLMTGEDSAFGAAEHVEQALEAAPRPITVGILGMGEDGHTASLFPGAADGEAAMAADARGRVAAVSRVGPGPVREGMTMTLPELAAHEHLVFLITGPSKQAVMDAILTGAEAARRLPAARVMAAARGPVDIFWAP